MEALYREAVDEFPQAYEVLSKSSGRLLMIIIVTSFGQRANVWAGHRYTAADQCMPDHRPYRNIKKCGRRYYQVFFKILM